MAGLYVGVLIAVFFAGAILMARLLTGQWFVFKK
jgi:hypothetical protein